MANEGSAGYMTVPEKIELSNSNPTGYPVVGQPPSDHKYKPMKVSLP